MIDAMTFSRATFLAAAALAERMTHADVTRLFLQLAHDDRPPEESKSKRLSRFLNDGPLHVDKIYHDEARDRGFITAVAEDFHRLARWEIDPNRWAKDEKSRKGVYDRTTCAFLTAVEADGYVLSNEGRLAPAVPTLDESEPPSDGVVRLLRRFGFDEAQDHRRQAMDAYRDGNWASANAQTRTFLLALVHALYGKLVRGPAPTDKAARDALATLEPPFLRRDVKEWDPQANNTFLHGVFSRLAEDGSHPGLSWHQEAKFRLRMADVIALDWLERLASRAR